MQGRFINISRDWAYLIAGGSLGHYMYIYNSFFNHTHASMQTADQIRSHHIALVSHHTSITLHQYHAALVSHRTSITSHYFHVTSCHVTRHHIISHHITSYHITHTWLPAETPIHLTCTTYLHTHLCLYTCMNDCMHAYTQNSMTSILEVLTQNMQD